MERKPVLLVVASEGYQQVEYNQTKKALEAVGLTTNTASNSAIPAIAKDGSTTLVDIALDNVDPKKYAAVVFIGGPGALENLDNEESYRVIKQASKEHVPLGAICVAPRILINAGIMADKRATGWDGDHKLTDFYKDHDVVYVHQPVVADGMIITGSGPEAAAEFGKEIAHLVKKLHGGIE